MDFEEQKSICTVCGHRHKLTAHHKIRRSNGGTNERHNLVGVCRPCHDQIHGHSRGCTDDGGYYDVTAAAAASAQHWAIVMEWWTHKGMLDLYDRREEAARLYRERYLEEPTHFASLIYAALEETEPRCT